MDSNSESSPIGYILELDLEYCKKLHDNHIDYPLAPEELEISSNMLPKYCSDNKLVPKLRDKVKYIVHYRNLQLYLELGIKLIKIYRILKFKQSNLLKEHIEFNTQKRKSKRQIQSRFL